MATRLPTPPQAQGDVSKAGWLKKRRRRSLGQWIAHDIFHAANHLVQLQRWRHDILEIGVDRGAPYTDGLYADKPPANLAPSVFPRSDRPVQLIEVTSESGQSCTMAFKEGSRYKFTVPSVLKAPPHGVLAKTGATKFLYLPFTGYKGQDSYAIKICAIARGRKRLLVPDLCGGCTITPGHPTKGRRLQCRAPAVRRFLGLPDEWGRRREHPGATRTPEQTLAPRLDARPALY